MEDPYFPLYVQDFLVGTMYMTNKQVGAYIRMLCRQWDSAKLSTEEANMLCHDLTESEKEKVFGKFKNVRGWLINPRLKCEKSKRLFFRQSQSEKGRKSARKRASLATAQEGIEIPPTTVEPRLNRTPTESQPEGNLSSSSSLSEEEEEVKKLHCEGSPEKPEPSRQVALRVLEFLNQKTGRSYRAYEGENGKRKPTAGLEFILARIKDGATESDMRGVIVRKCRQWKGDPEKAVWLRPATLFNRTKYDQYIGEQEYHPETAYELS